MSGLQDSNRQHGIWLLLLTLFMLGWWAWGLFLKPKKENYEKLWMIQAEHEARIQKLERKYQ